jgi:hypothetical protein
MAQHSTKSEETMPQQEKTLPNGEAAAALLAAGIGCLILGVVTTLAAANTAFANSLKWVTAVGPLSGKTTIAVVAWLLVWVGLSFALSKKQVDFTRVFVITLILVGLGLLGTFPLFYDLFAG